MHKSLLLYNIRQQCYGVCVNGYVFVLGYVTKKIFIWIEYKSRSPKKPHLFRESSLQRGYKVLNSLADSQASIKPSAANIISETSSKSGTTMAKVLGKEKNP